MSRNPEKSIRVVPAASVVLNSLGTPLISSKLSIRQADTIGVQVQITTVGSMTDLRIRAYVSQLQEPIAFTAGGNVDWSPVGINEVASGIVSPYPWEATFQEADWFASDGQSVFTTLEAQGQWLVLVLYDGAGVGTTSSVAVDVFLRKSGK